MKAIKIILKYAVLFSVGGIAYCCIETLWRGHTHWTMFIVGGLAFLFCGAVNELLGRGIPIWRQMLICAIGITVIEFVSGVIINLEFGLHVWDYSNLPFNVLGQICLPFSIIWFFLSFLAILLDDWIRYLFFGEEKPHYKIK